MRYIVDRSLIESDPRWALVGEAERDEIAELIDQRGRMVSAIKRYREITGKGLAEGKNAVESIIAGIESGRRADGPPCHECGAPLRTKKAEQCFACGADWHGKSSKLA